ncbi:MAG: Asp-tRNA(Asn)/Glu-tRNA(Gln) amidotransferase subunit GatC [Flavobacteriales bacterium]|nr:Asp-tRNA(Asn)/Glu-tRNA(Gln) amidotransferase subunit GatC [Flavobacteriales bacterium]
MAVEIKEVERIASLSKLEFSDAEKIEVTADMNRMLDFVKQLETVDTEGVKPLIYMLEEEAVLREDKVIESITQKDALKNAPEKDTDFIKVPKVLNK